MDTEQIQSISRIRSIVHEGLRDHIEEIALASTTPENESGKRGRGKEKVRRKNNMGKRKRKDDLENFNAICEGIPIHMSHTVNAIDNSHLCLTDNEVDQSQLCLTTSDGDVIPTQLCSNDVDESQLCHVVSEVGDSQLCDMVNGVDSQFCDVVRESDQKPSLDTIEVITQSALETSEDNAQKNGFGVLA